MALTVVTVQDAVLHHAHSLRWVRETNGANRSEVIDQMIALTSLDPAQRLPWCAAYVAYTGYGALRKGWPLKKVAGCMSLMADLKAKGMLRATPAMGAVFLLWGKGWDGVQRFKHTGFCVSPNPDGTWNTIEGNTNEAGSAEGDGVFERVRRFGATDRFGHWWL